MAKAKIWETWRFDVAKKMPPMRHSVPGEAFDITKSEVIKWLVSQPDIMQLVFNAVRNKYIVYDKETGTWRGIEHEN